MQLSRVIAQHFRSLYDVSLPLKPLTIVIGPNASGKSNLFKALRFLYDGVAGDRRDWQAYDAQIDHLRWYGLAERGQPPNSMLLALWYEQISETLAYEAKFVGDDLIRIGEEFLLLDREKEKEYLFRRRDTSITVASSLFQPFPSKDTMPVRSARTLTLRDEGPAMRYELAQALYRHIGGWRFLDVNVNRARQDSFVPEIPEEMPALAGDGSNLSAFLYALWRLQPDDFAAINDALADFIDLPQQVLVEHDAERGGSNARYGFWEKPFGENRVVPPSSMSDGTIRLLSQLALLLGDRSVTLACLEEPDHGLHPRLMRYLADVLRQAVTPIEDAEGILTPPPQVIVTTHSPEFMDCFDLEVEKEYVQVYIAERDEEGKTHFIPASAPEFAPWLEKYRLGEAVRRRFV